MLYCVGRFQRLLPAPAGVILCAKQQLAEPVTAPRARGGDPARILADKQDYPCSPRPRG